MKKQRELAKSGQKFISDNIDFDWQLNFDKDHSIFEGYLNDQIETKIVNYAFEDENLILVLYQTPFYAESGGQIGDTGIIKNSDFSARVLDTQKNGEFILHFCQIDSGAIGDNLSVNCAIDLTRRKKIKNNHTATHLLHQAVKDTLGNHVNQAGSLVDPDYLRFDITHPNKISKNEINQIEEIVNQKINDSINVETKIKSLDEAKKEGATALFGEKYGDLVRVVTLGSFQNNPYSIELCGGTHVSNTNLIKKFLITSEESVSSGVRRIEACTANRVDEYLNNQQKEQENYENKLDLKISELIDEIKTFGEMPISSLENRSIYIKKLEAQVDSLKNKSILNTSKIVEKKVVKGVNFIAQVVDGLPPKELRSIFDNFKNENSNSILACITTTEDKVSIIVGVTADLKEAYDARELIKASFESLGSKGGGGRADFAQAGGTKKSSINEAFSAIQDKI